MQDPSFNLPSDRIKLTYSSEHSANADNIELPFKLLLLGNYKGYENGDSVSDRKSISVDKSNFADVMREADVNLSMDVKDRLSDSKQGQEATLAIDINFSRMRDFKPDAFVKQVPELDTLIKFRDLLTKAKTHPNQINKTVEEIKALLLAPNSMTTPKPE